MDAWTDEQMLRMKTGGNQQCQEFLKKHGVDFENCSVKERYDSPAATLYKQVLDARIAGKPEPTELPVVEETAPNNNNNNSNNGKNNNNNNGNKKKMEGFGSGPHRPQNDDGRSKLGAYVLVVAGVIVWLTAQKFSN